MQIGRCCAWLIKTAILCGLLTGMNSATAADRIYDTSVKLKIPKKVSKRTEGKADEVLMSIWIPDSVKIVRGAVYNPFYRKAVTQKHWQAACRHWNFAIVSSNHFGVKKQEMASSVRKGLEQLAEESGHREAAHLPLCPVGMSAGAGMSVNIAADMPERIIAAGPVCLEVGPRNEASYKIPMITIFGERDGKQMEKLAERLPAARAEDAQFATAVQWKRRHEFARANNLLMPFFDHVIEQRYPAGASPLKGTVKLKDLPLEQGWLGDPATWTSSSPSIASYQNYKGKKTEACWLPDRYVAHVWQSFVASSPAVKIVAPAGMGDGQPFNAFPAGKPIKVQAAVKKRTAIKKLELYDGDRLLATFKNNEAEFAPAAPGIYALIAAATLEDGSRHVSPPNTIVVAE